MKQVFTAKTIEEAKAMAAAEFGVEESRINFNRFDYIWSVIHNKFLSLLRFFIRPHFFC